MRHRGHSSDLEEERSSQNCESPKSHNVPKLVLSSTSFVSLKLERKNKEKLLPPFSTGLQGDLGFYFFFIQDKEILPLPASSEVLRL